MTPDLTAFLASLGPAQAGHRPWPRHSLDRAGWSALLDRLASSDWSLLGLWGESEAVHLALRDESEVAVASLACLERRYPAVSLHRSSAIRLERAMRDLFGLEAEGAADPRPWLDHGRWPASRAEAKASYEFLRA